jgi:hypothetical protein
VFGDSEARVWRSCEERTRIDIDIMTNSMLRRPRSVGISERDDAQEGMWSGMRMCSGLRMCSVSSRKCGILCWYKGLRLD